MSSNQLPPQTHAQLPELDDAGQSVDSRFRKRGLESLERAKSTGVYFSADEVLSDLEARLCVAKAQPKR